MWIWHVKSTRIHDLKLCLQDTKIQFIESIQNKPLKSLRSNHRSNVSPSVQTRPLYKVSWKQNKAHVLWHNCMAKGQPLKTQTIHRDTYFVRVWYKLLQGLHLLIDPVSPTLKLKCTSMEQLSIADKMKGSTYLTNQNNDCNLKDKFETHTSLDCSEHRCIQHKRLRPTRSERLWTSAALVLLVVLVRPSGRFFKSADSSSPSWKASVITLELQLYLGRR